MGDDFLAYRRAKFTTRLPTDRSYTEGHLWIAPDAEGHRVGFTRFATRMLGEVVEFVRDRLPRETLDKLGHAQHPAFFFPTGDPTLRELPMSKIVKPQ